MSIKQILVVGNGSMGQRRVRIIKGLLPSCTVHTLDPAGGDSTDFTKGEDVNPTTYNALFICSPPVNHGPWVQYAIEEKIPVFVEKPYCLPGELLWAKSVSLNAQKPVMVGHNLLWHKGFQRFKAECAYLDLITYHARYGNLLTNWARENKDSYSRHRDQGGGVLLDCLQDIDLALDVTGGLEPRAYSQQVEGSTITVDSEYLCMIVARQPSLGFHAILSFDYLHLPRIRKHSVMGSGGEMAEWEENKGDELDQSYVDETEAFLKWVDTGRKPKMVPDPFRALDFVRRIYNL